MAQPARALIEGRAALLVCGAEQRAVAIIRRLIDTAHLHAVPVIFSVARDAAPPYPVRSGDTVIHPRRHSVFFGTELSIVLREHAIQTVIMAGGITSVSVHYSYVDAHQNDFFCRVVEDSMAGSSPAAHEAALRAMEYMQTGARRMAQAVLAALAVASAPPRDDDAESNQ